MEDTDDTVVSVCSETVILCLFVFCCLHELWYRLQLLTVLVRGQISGLKYNDTSRYTKLRSLQTRVAASRLYASASLRFMSLLHTSCLLEINKFKKLRTHVQPDELYDHYSFKVDSKDEHHQTQLWNPVTTSPSVPELRHCRTTKKRCDMKCQSGFILESFPHAFPELSQDMQRLRRTHGQWILIRPMTTAPAL